MEFNEYKRPQEEGTIAALYVVIAPIAFFLFAMLLVIAGNLEA